MQVKVVVDVVVALVIMEAVHPAQSSVGGYVLIVLAADRVVVGERVTEIQIAVQAQTAVQADAAVKGVVIGRGQYTVIDLAGAVTQLVETAVRLVGAHTLALRAVVTEVRMQRIGLILTEPAAESHCHSVRVTVRTGAV